MPSHIGQTGQSKNGKPFFQQVNSTNALETQLTTIVGNIRDKVSLGWSMAQLKELEKQIKK